ncbi:serine/threonine-protein kinase Elm1p [Monosporozyma servazzii]
MEEPQSRIPSLLPDSVLQLENFTNINPSLIKTYNDLIQIFLPHIKQITSTSIIEDDPQKSFNFISKIGKGQYGTVYKCKGKKDNKIVAIKKLSKHGYSNKNVAIFGMNQILRQLERWKQMGWLQDWSSNEIMMILNLIKIRWEIVIMQRLTQTPSNSYVVNFIQCMDFNTSPNIWLVYEWCNLGELQWQRDDVNLVPSQWEMVLSHNNNKQFSQPMNTHSFVLKVLHDITHGLAFLKKCKVIHRDIKPANILVDNISGKLKISDYGCSIIEPIDDTIFNYKGTKIPFELIQECYQKEVNKIVGTPAFIPPELCQFGNLQNIESKTIIDGYKIDIWALGIMLYCIIYNELPFCGDNEFATYHQITSRELHFENRDDDQVTRLIIQRLLNKDPQKRISVDALLSEVQKSIPTVTDKSIKPKQDKAKSIKSFFSRLWNKNKSGKISSRPDKDKKERSSPINVAPLNTNEEFAYPDSESIGSSFGEPVLVTDPFEMLSVNKLITPGDVLLMPDSPEDTHSSPELYSRQSYSPHKLLDRRDTLISSTSLEIMTPIKKLIRINNTPEKKTSPTNRPKSNKLSFTNRRIPASNNIINFKTLLSHQEQESSETIEDIKQYLNFADN